VLDLPGETRSIHECGALEARPQFRAQRREPNKILSESRRDGDERLVGFGG
jgi:hypothetical protein